MSLCLIRQLLLLLLLLVAAASLYTVLQQQPAHAFCTAGGRRALSPSLPFHRGRALCSSSSSSSSSGSNNNVKNSNSSNSSNTFSIERALRPLFSIMEETQINRRSVGEVGGADAAAAQDVPDETPEEVKAEIRRRRRLNMLAASRVLQNDSLRVALMGPEAYTAFVSSAAAATPAAAAAAAAAAAGSFSVPVWVMRQAGRYLPEFRAVRAKHKFMTVCKDPLLAADVTLQPFKRFPLLDAVIIFSDILVLPEAMGMPLTVEEGEGPRFGWRIETPADIRRLDTSFDVEEKLGYVFDAIYTTAEQLKGAVPVIGFSGGPLTLFCYMVEGGASKKGLQRAKEFLFKYPEESLLLLQQIAAAAAKFLSKQVEAGAQVLQVFDTNAGFFAPEQYEEFGVPFMNQIAQALSVSSPGVPVIAFAKDRPSESFVSSSFAAVGVSWSSERSIIKQRFHRVAAANNSIKCIQGDLDPQILYAPDITIQKETARMVRAYQPGRYVANLGHGMEPSMDPHKLGVFIKAVKDTAAQIQKEQQAKTAT